MLGRLLHPPYVTLINPFGSSDQPMLKTNPDPDIRP